MLHFDDSYKNAHKSKTPFSLSELNSMVGDAIHLTLTDSYWVVAELASVQDRGHCYMELVEKASFGNTPIAQARACCWRNTWSAVRSKFVMVVGENLRVGMKVMLKVKPSFHNAYGFSWIIEDIDPQYTMGDMAQRRREILAKLREEGVIDLNKELTISQFAQRIAVVSSDNAAGYGDFINQLSGNDYGFRFDVSLFPAIMQGEHVEESVMYALDSIYEQIDDFDVVVIIRGGGSVADLSGFDTLPLAEHVANFPLPIITGIGHERDRSVLDEIACVSLKTPTAVATWLIDNLAQTYGVVRSCAERMVAVASGKLQLEQLLMQRLSQQTGNLLQQNLLHQSKIVERLQFQTAHASERLLSLDVSKLSNITTTLPLMSKNIIIGQKNQLSITEHRVRAVDPVNILNRGYSIVTYDGHSVKNISGLQIGSKVKIQSAKGSATAIIDAVE